MTEPRRLSLRSHLAIAAATALLGGATTTATARADEMGQHVNSTSWSLTWGGYLHVAYRIIQKPEHFDFAGNNNGFQLEQARLGANLEYRETLAARISFEGASEDRLSQSFPGGTLTARLRDAYVTWAPLRALRLSVGQMLAPFDLDSMRSDAELPFVSRSVASEGVQPSEGRPLIGMGVDRSLGLALHSGDIGLGDVASLRYALLVGNSNGQNQILNSGNLPAVFGRLEFALWGTAGLLPDRIGPIRARTDDARLPLVGLGVAARWNPTTTGDPPNLITQTTTGVAADLIVAWSGLDLEAGLVYTRTAHDTLTDTPDLEKLGWWAHLRFTIPRLPVLITPGYRIASYAPRAHLASSAKTPADVVLDDDLGLLYHTFGFTLRPTATFPMHMALNYTLTREKAGNVLSNDRFEVDLAVVF